MMMPRIGFLACPSICLLLVLVLQIPSQTHGLDIFVESAAANSVASSAEYCNVTERDIRECDSILNGIQLRPYSQGVGLPGMMPFFIRRRSLNRRTVVLPPGLDSEHQFDLSIGLDQALFDFGRSSLTSPSQCHLFHEYRRCVKLKTRKKCVGYKATYLATNYLMSRLKLSQVRELLPHSHRLSMTHTKPFGFSFLPTHKHVSQFSREISIFDGAVVEGRLFVIGS